jgi:mono/diheme cytochrome c family protein
MKWSLAVLSVVFIAGRGNCGADNDSRAPEVAVQGDQQHTSRGAIESGQGRAVYDQWCSACHNEGPLFPGTAALRVKYKGALPAGLLQRTDLTPELVKYYVRHGFSAMPIFRKTEISDRQLRLLSLFLMHQE